MARSLNLLALGATILFAPSAWAAGQVDDWVSLARSTRGVGDRHREAALHNNLADLLYVAGRSEEAMAHLKRAVAIFAEIGVDAGEMQPEIWKLVEW
jgi:hypothetical protein